MMRAGAAFSGALAAKCSRQKLCGSFAMPGNATGYGLRTADYGLRTTDDGDGKMANSKCSANFNWLGPFVYPFVLIYLHVICFDRHLCRPLSLARSLVTHALARSHIFFSLLFLLSCFSIAFHDGFAGVTFVCLDASYLWLLCALSICIVRLALPLYILPAFFFYFSFGQHKKIVMFGEMNRVIWKF